MKKPSLINEWLPPTIIWIGSLYAMPQSLFILGLIGAYALRRNNNFIRSSDFVWVIFIVFISLVNFLYGLVALPDGMAHRHPYFLVYIFTFILASQLKKRDMQIIAYLITLECGFVFLEMALGKNTIFTSHPEYRSDLTFSMLYFARPFGLSDGPNSLGGKILIAIIISDYLLEKSLFKNIIRLILVSALTIVFSRTAIAAAFVHYLIYFFFHADVRNKARKVIFSLIALVSVQLVIFSSFPEMIFEQLNRGKENGVDFSYRDIIWRQCIDFIEQHPFLGNGSSRFHVWLADYGAWEHAHNSFLHLFATNGILVATLTLLWLGSRVTKSNSKLIAPVIIFSLGQYGIFWGISFVDIIFLYLLLPNNERPFGSSLRMPRKADVHTMKERHLQQEHIRPLS